jgi:hypothetical protein
MPNPYSNLNMMDTTMFSYLCDLKQGIEVEPYYVSRFRDSLYVQILPDSQQKVTIYTYVKNSEVEMTEGSYYRSLFTKSKGYRNIRSQVIETIQAVSDVKINNHHEWQYCKKEDIDESILPSCISISEVSVFRGYAYLSDMKILSPQSNRSNKEVT